MKEIEQFDEWQEHQYEPGYWVGKKSPLLRRRPNKLGYLIVIWGALYLLFGIILNIQILSESLPFAQFMDVIRVLLYVVGFILIPVAFIAAGIAWATPPRKKKRRSHRKRG